MPAKPLLKDVTKECLGKVFYVSGYDDIYRWLSYYHQISVVNSLKPGSVLDIGIGNKIFSWYIKSLGIPVITCDVDPGLSPDVVADVRSLPHPDNSFDAAVAFEVLEHLPWADVPVALCELRRVTRKHAVVSVPVAGAFIELALRFSQMQSLLRRRHLDCCLHLPVGFAMKCSPCHQWEIGLRGYSISRIRAVLRNHFRILKECRPLLNPRHRFFVLEKRVD